MAAINPQIVLGYARDDNADAIETLMREHGPDYVFFQNRIGQTALHVAAIQGSLNAIKKLVELGLDVNIENIMLQTPLHFAAGAHKNAYQACQLLLDLGADPFVMDQRGHLPYQSATDDAVRALLGGPDPRLYTASALGDVETLREIFDKEPETEDVSPPNAEGTNPLLLAAENGHTHVVEYLLDKGAFPNQQHISTGESAMHAAARRGDIDLLSLLHSRGADMNLPNFHKSTYAQGGWKSKNGEELTILHQTPLHVAVEEGNEAGIKQLITLGGNVEALDFDGLTPLHYTIEAQDTYIARILLQDGKASPNKGCKDFASPLHVSCQQGAADMVEILLEYGADPSITDEQGWTPLMLATRNGKVAAIKALVKSLIQNSQKRDVVTARNAAGNTVFHLAAANGRIDVCKALIAESGESIVKEALSLENKDGKKAVDLAGTHDDMKRLLMQSE